MVRCLSKEPLLIRTLPISSRDKIVYYLGILRPTKFSGLMIHLPILNRLATEVWQRITLLEVTLSDAAAAKISAQAVSKVYSEVRWVMRLSPVKFWFLAGHCMLTRCPTGCGFVCRRFMGMLFTSSVTMMN